MLARLCRCRMMDRYQVRYALLKVSLLALGACTWVSWSFIFSMRPEESEASVLTDLVRLPASIPQQLPLVVAPGRVLPEVIAMNEVKVPCWDRSESADHSTLARWVRLTGKACLTTNDHNDEITVRNLTNGYVATVFPTQNKTLTTDFIPLRNGRNEILIRFNQGAGVALENRVSFVRR